MTDPAALKSEFLVTDEPALRALFADTHELAIKKQTDRMDDHAKEFIARCPFLCIGTQSPDGVGDVSPRGDPRGFVQVLDDRTLLIPDRPGNNRLDTQSNIVANPAVGLLFMIPGFDDTLRINGRAFVSCDPDLLEAGAMHGRAPKTVIVVQVQEVYMHCAKAFRRSKLWDPSEHQDRKEMASLMTIMLDQTVGAPEDAESRAALDAQLEDGYRKSMY